jgi:hypothetical protein
MAKSPMNFLSSTTCRVKNGISHMKYWGWKKEVAKKKSNTQRTLFHKLTKE